jgi:hypothetical protein
VGGGCVRIVGPAEVCAVLLGFGAGFEVLGACVGAFELLCALLGVGRVGVGCAELAGPAGGSAVAVSGGVWDALTTTGWLAGVVPVGVAVPAGEPPPVGWSCAGAWFTGLLQATQARTTATAAAAALA